MAAVPDGRVRTAALTATALAALPFAAVLAGGLRSPVWAAGGLLALWTLAALAPARPRARAALPWLAWAGWTLLCAAAGPEPLVSAAAAARAAAGALVFAAARAWTEEDADRWVVALTATGLIVAAAAAVTGGLAFARGGTLRDAAVSMTGVIPPYYNYSAFVAAAAAAAAFACAVAPGGTGAARRSWAAAAGLLALALLLARSRGGQLGFLAGAALALGRAGGRRAWLALGAAALVAAGTFATKAGLPGQQRPKLWRAALLVAADRPLLGEGPDRFEAGFARRNFPSGLGIGRYQMSTPRAHSEPLEAAATTGFPGAALLLAAMLWPLALALRRRRESAAREAALAAAVAMTAQLCVDNMLHLPGLLLLYASALGAAAPAGPAAPARSGWRAACAAAALASLAAFVPAAALEAGRKRLESGLDAPARERLAREAVRLSPRDGAWREALGLALLEQGRPEEAAPQLEAALDLRPLRPFPAFELARARASRGRWDEALALCERALSPEPDFLSARLLRAEALVALGRRAEARSELSEARRRKAEFDRRADGLWLTPYDRALVAWDEKAARALARRLD